MNFSIFIIAHNESHNIADAIASAKFADEIIVVDNGSDDGTGKIALQAGAAVIRSEENLGFVEAKQLALEKCTNQWIFWLDADERITPELSTEIEQTISSPKNFVAFKMPRKSYFLKKWIRHCGWYPDYVVRLFIRESAKFSKSLVHEKLIIDGEIGKLSSPILHYTDPTLEHYLNKFNRYTTLAAQQMYSEGKKVCLGKSVFNPPATFIRMYFLKLGFLDGMHGFLLCSLSAMYVLVKYAKLFFLKYDKERKCPEKTS